MGGIEKDIQARVTGERMLTVFNELQRGYTAELRETKNDVRDMLTTQDQRNDKRMAEMQTYLERSNNAAIAESSRENKTAIKEAVDAAIAAERTREAEAVKAIEARARSAVLGISLAMKGGWAIVGGVVCVVALFIVKMTLGWSPFG